MLHCIGIRVLKKFGNIIIVLHKINGRIDLNGEYHTAMAFFGEVYSGVY